MKDNNTKHFIIGVLSGLLFIPIIEEFMNVIMTWIQVLLLLPNKIILKGNKELTDLQSEEQEEQEYETSCIVFQIPNEEEYYDEDDDE